MILMKENYRSLAMRYYLPFGRVKTNFSLSMTLPDESASFLYILYIFYNTLYTMPKKSRKDMFNSDSSDNEYYFELDKIEDNDSASDNGNKFCSTSSRFRSFNISNDSNSDDELNIDENNISFDNE